MVNPDAQMTATEPILDQGKSLVRAIESLGPIQRFGPVEHVITGLLRRAHRRQVRAADDSWMPWMSEN